jgi:hypothetical protein
MKSKMTSIIVKSQEELDKALAAEVPEIIIDSPKGVWIDISTNGKSELSVRGSATIGYVRDSATIGYVRDSATIRDVRDSATIRDVRDSATIGYVGDSATIRDVGGSATIGYVRDSATIRDVRGSATIGYVRDSATIGYVRDSATIGYVRDSATIGYVGDSATIRDVGGSATIGYVRDSATIGYVRDSATIHLYGMSKIEHTGSHVAVFLHSARATTSGGVIIDLSKLDLTVAKDWLDFHGVEIDEDGHAVLFKAVGDDWQTDRGPEWTYAPGNTVVAKDFKNTQQCGQGLHLGITPRHSRSFHTDATRFVAVKVKVEGLVPLDDKCKVRSCEVLHEVDINGDKLEMSA